MLFYNSIFFVAFFATFFNLKYYIIGLVKEGKTLTATNNSENIMILENNIHVILFVVSCKKAIYSNN